MKKKILILLLITVLVILVYNCASFIKEYTSKTTPEGGSAVTVEIPRGSSDKAIAEILKENGIIKYEMTFRLKMRSSPYSGKLNYGKYTLVRGMCLDDIIQTLLRASETEKEITLTIPEGYSAEMIAKRCENIGLVNEKDFLNELENGVFDYAFIKDIPDKDGVKYKLQGYLFPNTYAFKKSASAHTVIDRLLKEFEKQYSSVKNNNSSGMNMNDTVIAASLIEREAKLATERPAISGVIQNRLKKNMRLQIDASVVYVISGGMYDVARVYYKDLKTDSPYNTYVVYGLPAGAICNPGISSIEAALNPESHNYLYYHTDTDKNDGSHVFSETFSEHKS